MKRGILAVVMAAVAALFLVEVSMEELFIHRRLQQTMGQGAMIEDVPEIITVVITENGDTPMYLLLCSREEKKLRICSVEPDTQIPDPQGGMTTIRRLGTQKGIRTLVSGVSDALGVHGGDYLAMDVRGICQLVDAMGGVPLRSEQAEYSAMQSGHQVEALLKACELDHPELMLLRGMVQRIGSVPYTQLPTLAVQGVKYVKTNVSFREILEQGASLMDDDEIACKTMILPGTIPAIWNGSGDMRRCSYDLGQATGSIGEFFAGKD